MYQPKAPGLKTWGFFHKYFSVKDLFLFLEKIVAKTFFYFSGNSFLKIP